MRVVSNTSPISNLAIAGIPPPELPFPLDAGEAAAITLACQLKAEVMGNKVELTGITPESGRVVKKRRGLLVISTGGKKFNATEAVRVVREERS